MIGVSSNPVTGLAGYPVTKNRELVSNDYFELLDTPCPICGGKLYAGGPESWIQADNGDWIADSLQIDCETEPDIDSDEWEEWHRWHYRQPYMDWLPIESKALEYWQAKYRYEIN